MGEIFLAIIGGGAGAAFVAGVFTVIQWWLNRRAAREDRKEDRKAADCAARGREIGEVQKKIDALFIANRMLLYDRIKHLGKSYISCREITPEELEDIMAMHACYHTDLNGNGFLDNVMRQVQELPIKTKQVIR